ncbi:MAG: dTDP-4-dehydrorhamnose 3,5-epimerase [Actinomycetota bacterium]|jgi:dTDP-4-dehydrorhamnose 3,5-epimerase|nr:dTDP-4-dehydrorhamnose 3,5-epimerase [Actinomycetota bacterium]
MTIPGVVVTRLERFEDERGHFSEIARAADISMPLTQSSHSHSKKDVLRGLHFHREQSDLWYLAVGRAQIALVDLRDHGSQPSVMTFVADASEPSTIFVPPGVAHGYLALTDIDMLYWTSHTYDPTDEQGILWNDPSLAIAWDNTDPALSERDRGNPPLTWQDIPRF